jgi:hypothetical protein
LQHLVVRGRATPERVVGPVAAGSVTGERGAVRPEAVLPAVRGDEDGPDSRRLHPARHLVRGQPLRHQLTGQRGTHIELAAQVGPALGGEHHVGQHPDQQQHRGQHQHAQRGDPAAQ